MSLDAIVIADSNQDSLSDTNPLKLSLDGKTATIQAISNYIKNKGRIITPIEGDATMSWSAAYKLNGISLINYLEKHKFNVELTNSFYEEQDVFCSLLKYEPKAVIISTTFIHSKPALRKLVNDIRSLAPDIFIIAGGPYVHFSYLILQRSSEEHYDTESANNDYLFLTNEEEPSVDLYIISPRGERILCEALKKVKENRPIENLPNTARLVGKTYIFTQQITDISYDEDSAMDWENLPDAIFKPGVIPMQASKGCPYRCAFCNFTKDRRFNYIKPMDQLMDELKDVSRRGIKYVWFVDDIFRLGKGDLHSFCQRIVDEDLQIYWMSFIRASTLKNVDLELLQRSGCIELQIGLESANPQVLRNMNKKVDPSLYAEVIQKLLAVGINCSCYFIFGFPGETDETTLSTREFLKCIEHPELKGILTWSIFPFMLSPLSPIYEPQIRKMYGLTGYMQNWKHETMNNVQAKEHIKKTFFELENSGPIYRDDNIELLLNLSPSQRKKFVTARHRLSKLSMKCQLEKYDVIKSFSRI